MQSCDCFAGIIPPNNSDMLFSSVGEGSGTHWTHHQSVAGKTQFKELQHQINPTCCGVNGMKTHVCIKRAYRNSKQKDPGKTLNPKLLPPFLSSTFL